MTTLNFDPGWLGLFLLNLSFGTSGKPRGTLLVEIRVQWNRKAEVYWAEMASASHNFYFLQWAKSSFKACLAFGDVDGPSLLFFCYPKHMIKSNLLRRGFIWLRVTVYSPSWKVDAPVQAGTWRQYLEQRPQRIAAYWLDLHGFINWRSYTTQMTCLGVAPHTVG